jgi:hypothetical protein
VVSTRKWVKIGVILAWFILFVPQYYWNPFYWNRPQVFIGQYEHLIFGEPHYFYDVDSWVFTLDLNSIGNIPVYIREMDYTLYEGQTPVNYEVYIDNDGNVIRKDLLRNAVMVPNDETIIVDGDVCAIVGYIYSDADFRAAKSLTDRNVLVESRETSVYDVTYIDYNGKINHREYFREDDPIKIPSGETCIVQFRVPDAERGDTIQIVFKSTGMGYTKNIKVSTTQFTPSEPYDLSASAETISQAYYLNEKIEHLERWSPHYTFLCICIGFFLDDYFRANTLSEKRISLLSSSVFFSFVFFVVVLRVPIGVILVLLYLYYEQKIQDLNDPFVCFLRFFLNTMSLIFIVPFF